MAERPAIFASSPPWVRLRRSRSISQAPKVSSFETCETSMKIFGRLPRQLFGVGNKLLEVGRKARGPRARGAQRKSVAPRNSLQCRVAAHVAPSCAAFPHFIENGNGQIPAAVL